METLTAEQAASLLHMQAKRVRALARAGKLPGSQVGRKWLFRRDELEGLIAGKTTLPAGPHVSLSARNRLRGRIVRLRLDGLMAEVVLAIGDQTLVSVITRSSAERMELAEGQEVFAVMKSTEVMIGKETAVE
jgi:molybdopterin-binding protein